MKKLIFAFPLLILILLLSNNQGWAAFTSVEISTLTASATIGEITEEEEPEESTSTTTVVGPDGGDVEITNAKIVIPEGALDKYVSITIEKRDVNDAPAGDGAAGSEKPVAFFGFSPDGLRFKKACELTLLYKDTDLHNIDEADLRIFWWDNFHWRLVGGSVNKSSNTVTVKIAHFSDYALFPLGELDKSSYRPRKKIITPYSEYNNCDRAIFDNLSDKNVVIKIFDITGKKIRTIDINFYNENGGYWWDGKDSDGDVVESGVYIYQFKVNGEVISGTIAVAK